MKLDYVTTNVDEELRNQIAALYKNVDKERVLETTGMEKSSAYRNISESATVYLYRN
jgi:hypothetical protein